MSNVICRFCEGQQIKGSGTRSARKKRNARKRCVAGNSEGKRRDGRESETDVKMVSCMPDKKKKREKCNLTAGRGDAARRRSSSKRSGARVNEEPLIKIRAPVSFGIVEIGTNGPLVPSSAPFYSSCHCECTNSHIKCGYITSRAGSNARYVPLARQGRNPRGIARARVEQSFTLVHANFRESSASDGWPGTFQAGQNWLR